MSSFYPTSLQDLDPTRGTSGQPLSSPNHITHHQIEDDTIEALQAKLGIDNSADATSIDYILKNSGSIDPGHKHTAASVSLALSNLLDVLITSPADGNGLIYDGTSNKWENKTTSTADASTTVKGVTKLSVAPVSPTAPIAVGDNDGRVPTQNENDALVGTSGTSVSSSNKLVDNADTATTAANNKVPRANGSGKIDTGWIDAAALSNVFYAMGLATDLATSSLGNNDLTITTGFQPRLIRLHYYIQGNDTSSGSGLYQGRKGMAHYNAVTLLADIPLIFGALSGDNSDALHSSITTGNFSFIVNSTTAPAIGATGGSGSGGIRITLSIASVNSTGFTIRRATASSDSSPGTARCSIYYEAFA